MRRAVLIVVVCAALSSCCRRAYSLDAQAVTSAAAMTMTDGHRSAVIHIIDSIVPMEIDSARNNSKRPAVRHRTIMVEENFSVRDSSSSTVQNSRKEEEKSVTEPEMAAFWPIFVIFVLIICLSVSFSILLRRAIRND